MGAFFFWIIVGAIAGWIAEKIMNGDHGLFTNIILGIIGAFVGGFLFSLIGLDSTGGWIMSIIVATIGAVIVIYLYRMIRGRTATS